MSEQVDLATLPIPGLPESASAPATPAEKKEKSALAEQKQAFNNLLAQQRERKKADKQAKAEKEPAEAAEPAKVAAAPVEATKAAPEPHQASAALSPEMEKIRAKSLLAGLPKKAIETLSEQELRDWWKGQEERVKNDTLVYQRASEAEKKLAALQGTTGKAEQVPTAEPDLEEIAAQLADKFGEDESGVLLTALQGLMAPLQRELKETRDILANARDRGLQDISVKNRDRLAAKLPMLKDNDSAWKVIQAQALERSKSDPSKFSSADAVYDDVFNDLYGGLQATPPPTPVADRFAEEKSRVAASALTPPGTQKREKKITPMDAAFSAFKVLRKNPEDLDGAKRAFGQAHLPQ